MVKRKRFLKALAGCLVGTLLLAGCGSQGDNNTAGGNAAENVPENMDDLSADFSFLTMMAFTASSWAVDYNDLPAVKYWLDMEWDANRDGVGKKLNLEFRSPTAGSEQDYVNTQISTGEYPDVMALVYSTTPVMELYDDGMIMDITEYVENYMPNYMAFLDSHPDLKERATFNIDGEKKYLMVDVLYNEVGEPWGGLMYRRDWIVKYGENPETGEAFSGSWIDGEWVDDVVFPSGSTDPVYISDWEWMLDIFDKALKAQNVTDGYAMQMCSAGVEGTGDIVILDEATASIDPENEHLIQQAISELTVGKTVIVIAHRLATIEHADQILVVDNGQIVQRGTHGQLIQQEGLYKRFINIREQAEGWSIA